MEELDKEGSVLRGGMTSCAEGMPPCKDVVRSSGDPVLGEAAAGNRERIWTGEGALPIKSSVPACLEGLTGDALLGSSDGDVSNSKPDGLREDHDGRLGSEARSCDEESLANGGGVDGSALFVNGRGQSAESTLTGVNMCFMMFSSSSSSSSSSV
jgi:hypothetical protein